MNRKIELIEQDGGWFWCILAWDGSGWYNAGCGFEKDFGAACEAARKDYGA